MNTEAVDCKHPFVFRSVTTIGTRRCLACEAEMRRPRSDRHGWYPRKPQGAHS